MKAVEMVTICDDNGFPEISLVQDHLRPSSFLKLFKEAHPGIQIFECDISHEFWFEDGNGDWWSSNKDDRRAVPVTIVDWSGRIPKLTPNGTLPH